MTITITPGWGTAAAINSGAGAVGTDPVLLADPSGNVTAGWLQQDGGAVNDVWANHLGRDGLGNLRDRRQRGQQPRVRAARRGRQRRGS